MLAGKHPAHLDWRIGASRPSGCSNDEKGPRFYVRRDPAYFDRVLGKAGAGCTPCGEFSLADATRWRSRWCSILFYELDVSQVDAFLNGSARALAIALSSAHQGRNHFRGLERAERSGLLGRRSLEWRCFEAV